MKLQELRVGNTVYNYNLKKEVKVCLTLLTSLNHDTVVVEREEYTFKPIELTEEILLNKGFKKKGRKAFVLEFEFDTISFESDEGFICYCRVNGVTFIRIKHLHELENLHYLLFNKDI